MPDKSRVPHNDRQRLAALTRRIQAGDEAAQARARIIDDLRQRGFTQESIADAAGITRQAIAKSVERHRRRALIDA